MRNKKYTMVVVEVDGKMSINRTNDGFNIFELIGALEDTKQDLIDQLKDMRSRETTRRVIKEDKAYTVEMKD